MFISDPADLGSRIQRGQKRGGGKFFSSYLFLAINFTKFKNYFSFEKVPKNMSQLTKNLCISIPKIVSSISEIWVLGSEIRDKLDSHPFWVFWSFGEGLQMKV
jgi:hypothetical protein